MKMKPDLKEKNEKMNRFFKRKDVPNVPQPLPNKSNRVVKRLWQHDNGTFFVMRITVMGKTPVVEEYFCQRLSKTACLVTKMEVGKTTQYMVLHGENKLCACDSFKYRDTMGCKHIGSLVTLFSEEKDS